MTFLFSKSKWCPESGLGPKSLGPHIQLWIKRLCKSVGWQEGGRCLAVSLEGFPSFLHCGKYASKKPTVVGAGSSGGHSPSSATFRFIADFSLKGLCNSSAAFQPATMCCVVLTKEALFSVLLMIHKLMCRSSIELVELPSTLSFHQHSCEWAHFTCVRVKVLSNILFKRHLQLNTQATGQRDDNTIHLQPENF